MRDQATPGRRVARRVIRNWLGTGTGTGHDSQDTITRRRSPPKAVGARIDALRQARGDAGGGL